eukprot:359504-Chlamydomonas_euryale.AAC.3
MSHLPSRCTCGVLPNASLRSSLHVHREGYTRLPACGSLQSGSFRAHMPWLSHDVVKWQGGIPVHLVACGARLVTRCKEVRHMTPGDVT